jgi:hypothetical protein
MQIIGLVDNPDVFTETLELDCDLICASKSHPGDLDAKRLREILPWAFLI